jgi:acetyl esterase
VLNHLKAGFPPDVFFFGDQDGSWKPGSDASLQQLTSLGNTSAELKGGVTDFSTTPWQDVTLAQADRFLVEHGFLSGSSTLAAPPNGEKLIKAH